MTLMYILQIAAGTTDNPAINGIYQVKLYDWDSMLYFTHYDLPIEYDTWNFFLGYAQEHCKTPKQTTSRMSCTQSEYVVEKKT